MRASLSLAECSAPEVAAWPGAEEPFGCGLGAGDVRRVLIRTFELDHRSHVHMRVQTPTRGEVEVFSCESGERAYVEELEAGESRELSHSFGSGRYFVRVNGLAEDDADMGEETLAAWLGIRAR